LEFLVINQPAVTFVAMTLQKKYGVLTAGDNLLNSYEFGTLCWRGLLQW